MTIANTINRTSLPSRSIVTLTCGHERKIRNKKAHGEFYCTTCDDFAPIGKILKNCKDF